MIREYATPPQGCFGGAAIRVIAIHVRKSPPKVIETTFIELPEVIQYWAYSLALKGQPINASYTDGQ
jgi:hypothetical protein